MMETSDIIEKLYVAELRYINRHLPIARKTFKELLTDPNPCIMLRDGGRHCFKRRELNELKKILNELEYEQLLLPIVIQIRRSKHGTEALVEGALEASVVEKLLGQSLGGSERGFVVLYPLQLIELTSRYTTIFQLTLAPPEVEEASNSHEQSVSFATFHH